MRCKPGLQLGSHSNREFPAQGGRSQEWYLWLTPSCQVSKETSIEVALVKAKAKMLQETNFVGSTKYELPDSREGMKYPRGSRIGPAATTMPSYFGSAVRHSVRRGHVPTPIPG